MTPPPVVVVGVDGSRGAFQALRVGAQLASRIGGRLIAVFVEHIPATVYSNPFDAAGSAVVASALAADEVHVECELALAGQHVDWSFEHRAGEPAAELQRAADDHDAACIVVGRHGHRALARFLTGSVTDRLVRNAHRAILVVPPQA